MCLFQRCLLFLSVCKNGGESQCVLAGFSQQWLSKALRVLCCLSGFTVGPSARLSWQACPLSCLPDSGSSMLGFVWRSGALHTAVETTQRQSESHSPPLSFPHIHQCARSGTDVEPVQARRKSERREAIVIPQLGCQERFLFRLDRCLRKDSPNVWQDTRTNVGWYKSGES